MIYKSAIKDDDINNDNEVVKTTTSSLVSSLLNFKISPVLNDLTFQKDVHVVESYGLDLFRFFKTSQCLSLPIFSDIPEPVGVKHIVADKTFNMQVGQELSFYIMPFSHRCGILMNGTVLSNIFTPETTKTFVYYRVVCCKIIVKQVGIMSMSDGYGTVMDAVVANPYAPVEYLAENLLSVQTGPGKKLMMVDGRTGFTAHFIGSSHFQPVFPAFNTLKPRFMVHASDETVYMPANIRFATVPASSSVNPEVHYVGDDENTPVGAGVHNSVKPFDKLIGGNAFCDLPEGEALFCRISAPSIQTSIKVYIEMVIEGMVRPEYLSDMPQMSPPRLFDFSRVKFAIQNVVPSLVQNQTPKTYMACDSVKQVGPLNIFKQPMLKKNASQEALWPKKDPSKVYSAMDKKRKKDDKKKIGQRFPAKGAVNFPSGPKAPKYITDASKFVVYPVTALSSSPATNRIFRDASTAIPTYNYQYFPIIDEKETEVVKGVVAYNLDPESIDQKEFETTSYEVTDYEKITKDVVFHYRPDDFVSPEDFLNCLDIIVDYAYGNNYHFSDNSEFYIRFFAPGKIDKTSYMLALLACIYGAPSGGYYTGSFSSTENGFIANEIPKKALQLKINSASDMCPLVVLSTNVDNGAFTNIISGVVPNFNQGKCIPTTSVDVAVLYFCLPFKVRLVKSTPMYQYLSSDKTDLAATMDQPYRWYICGQNVNSKDKLEAMLKKQMFFRDFAKANIDRFSYLIHHKKKYCEAEEFFKSYPSLLETKGFWTFRWKGKLWVDMNIASGMAREKHFPMMMDYGKNEVADEVKERKTVVKGITFGEAQEALKDGIKRVTGHPLKINIDVKEVVGAQLPPAKDYFPVLKELSDGFIPILANVQAFVRENPGDEYFTKNERLKSAFNNLKIPVKAQQDRKKIEKEMTYLETLTDNIGTGGVILIGYASGWPTLTKPRMKSSTLDTLVKYLKGHEIPEFEANGKLASKIVDDIVMNQEQSEEEDEKDDNGKDESSDKNKSGKEKIKEEISSRSKSKSKRNKEKEEKKESGSTKKRKINSKKYMPDDDIEEESYFEGGDFVIGQDDNYD